MNETGMFISALFIMVLYNDSPTTPSDNKNPHSQLTINTHKKTTAHLKIQFLSKVSSCSRTNTSG